MGTDKAFVTLHGRPLIQHLLERVADLGQRETFLVTNRPADYAHLGLPMFTDVLPGKGSLGGIYTALQVSRSAYTFVLAVDMPLVRPALLRYMVGLCAEDAYDVIVPCVEGHLEGLHAIYGKGCLAPIQQQLEADRLKVIAFYDAVRTRLVEDEEHRRFDPAGGSFFNVNTPTDLAEAARLYDADPL